MEEKKQKKKKKKKKKKEEIDRRINTLIDIQRNIQPTIVQTHVSRPRKAQIK